MGTKTQNRLIFLFIFILGLIPLLWFKGELITGTDVDFPLFPQERLIERLFTWYPKIQFGVNRSNNVGSIPYFLVAAFFSRVGFGVISVEKITFVFWFMLTGFSMWYLMNYLTHDEDESWVFYSKLLAILAYMVNFYNMFLWVRLQMAVTTQVFLPVFLVIFLRIIKDNKLDVFGLLLTLVIFALAGSLGIQPPIIYAIILATLMLLFYFLLFDVVAKDFKIFRSKLKKLLLFTIFAGFGSSYWAIPLLKFIFSSGLSGSDIGKEIYNVEDLLQWTSLKSSFLNQFRFYGDVVWFDSWGTLPYFPEFLTFTNTLLAKIFGGISMVGVALAVYYSKNKKTVLGFLAVLLLALFFSKGIHEPFDFIFKKAFNILPGFWIHRAPWQKFGIVFTATLAPLFGFGFGHLITHKKVKNGWVWFFVIVIVYLYTNKLFVLGEMFPPKESDIGYHGVQNLGFHHTFPKYVYDIGNYLNREYVDSNIMLLPDMSANVYDWGYAGSAGVFPLVSSVGTVFNPYGEGFTVVDYASKIYHELIGVLYEKDATDVQRYLAFFNIGGILQRNDFRYDFFGDFDSPEFIANQLALHGLEKDKSFGSWDIYSYENPRGLIYADLNAVNSSGIEENILYFVDKNPEGTFVNSPDDYSIISTPVSLVIPKEKINILDENYWYESWTWPEASVNPSDWYYFLVLIKEQIDINKSLFDKEDYVEKLVWYSTKRAVEYDIYSNIPEKNKKKLQERYINLQDKIFENLDETVRPTTLRKAVVYNRRAQKFFTEGKDGFEELNQKYAINASGYANKVCPEEALCYEFVVSKASNYYIKLVQDGADTSSYLDAVRFFRFDDNNSLAEGIEPSSESVFLNEGKYLAAVYLNSPNELLDQARQFTPSVEGFTQIVRDNNLYTPLINNGFNITQVQGNVFEPSRYNQKLLFSVDYSSEAAVPGILVIEESYDGAYKMLNISDFANLESAILRGDLSFNKDAGKQLCNQFGSECEGKLGVEFTVSSNSKNIYIYVFSLFKGLNNGKIQYTNPSLKEELLPGLVLESPVTYSTSKLEIDYKKINPTKYEVSLRNPGEPFYLIFGQSFDRGWKLYTDGKEVSADKHYLANFHANGWYIEPGVEETLRYTIEFLPQKMFITGVWISLSSIIVTGFGALIVKYKK